MTHGATAEIRKRKEIHWRRIVQGQPGSGLSIRVYCAQQRVREPSFYWWRRELTRRDAKTPAFVPVRVAEAMPVSTAGSHIEIVLSNDRRVQVVGAVDRQALADVLCVLEQLGAQPC